MIKKTLITLSAILTAISFYVIVEKYGVTPAAWALTSFAPYMLIAALGLLVKNGLLQTVFVPSLLFYGIGTFMRVPFKYKFSYAHISAAVMLAMAVYIIFTQIIKLKIFRILIGLLGGIILFIIVTVVRPKFVDHEDLTSIPGRENTLLYKGIGK